MKTLTNKFYCLAVIVAMVSSLYACDEENRDLYDEQTNYLCSRIWTDEWTDDEDVYYYQEISFYPDYTGKDYLYSKDAGPMGLESERTYYFNWDWDSYSSIYMRYQDGISYMDDVRLGNNKLDCNFDNVWVTFIGK